MRVALLQNFVAPYRVPLYEKLCECGAALRVFVSTPMESDRSWKVEWGTLDVVVQKNVTLRRRKRDPNGFIRHLQIHFPYDTIQSLWRYRPDTVISVELGPRTIQAVLYKLLRPSVRLLIWCKLSEHSEVGWGRGRLMLRRWLLARADGVLVNGESGARYIAGLGFPDRDIVRVNQPVDVAMFAEIPRQRGEGQRTRFLCCGVLDARKGVMPFLHEFDTWARAHPELELELWWLGDGALREEIRSFPCAPNLHQRLLGAVPYAELPQFYSQVDVLAFPTLLDEWGLVVNEAMAAGLPVMGSIYAQAVTELVVEGETGWIFDPKSSASVQGVLDRVHATPPEALADMREAARARIAGLTPQTAAQKIYRAALGSGGSRQAPTGWTTQASDAG